MTDLAQDPFIWVEKELEDLESLPAASGVSSELINDDDPRLLREVARDRRGQVAEGPYARRRARETA